MITDRQGNILLVRWNDNSVVTLCSSVISVHRMRNVKCWVRGKGQVNLFQPAMVGLYNSGMGSIDMLIMFCHSAGENFEEKSGIGLRQ